MQGSRRFVNNINFGGGGGGGANGFEFRGLVQTLLRPSIRAPITSENIHVANTLYRSINVVASLVWYRVVVNQFMCGAGCQPI